MTVFKVGTFELPVCAGFDISQRYEPLGGEEILRAVSGLGIKQMTWQKTRVTTSGTGWVPSGLTSLDFTAQHDVACISPETVPAAFSTRSATIPAARRADTGHIPYGLAQLADGTTVESPISSLVADVAVVTAVAGAVAYQVGYYPLLTCWVMRPTRTGQDYSWELIAEEV